MMRPDISNSTLSPLPLALALYHINTRSYILGVFETRAILFGHIILGLVSLSPTPKQQKPYRITNRDKFPEQDDALLRKLASIMLRVDHHHLWRSWTRSSSGPSPTDPFDYTLPREPPTLVAAS